MFCSPLPEAHIGCHKHLDTQSPNAWSSTHRPLTEPIMFSKHLLISSMLWTGCGNKLQECWQSKGRRHLIYSMNQFQNRSSPYSYSSIHKQPALSQHCPCFVPHQLEFQKSLGSWLCAALGHYNWAVTHAIHHRERKSWETTERSESTSRWGQMTLSGISLQCSVQCSENLFFCLCHVFHTLCKAEQERRFYHSFIIWQQDSLRTVLKHKN